MSNRNKSYLCTACLLYTSDAADERSSVDLGGRRIIKKKQNTVFHGDTIHNNKNTHKQDDCQS